MDSPEQWKNQISVKRPDDSSLNIMLRNQPNTYIVCRFNPAKKFWNLEDISVSSQNKGIGKELISELVRQLGPDQPVSSYVIEPDTIKRVIQAGWAQTAKEEPVTLDKPADLQALKFIRVMQGGGMETTKCVVVWTPYDEAGYTQQDIKDMIQNKSKIVDGDRVLTIHWFGKTPHQPVLQ
jgi:hypothetical protein